MSNDEQRLIHQAATEASERLVKAATLIGVTTRTIENRAARLMLTDAIGELEGATDSLHRLFVELNKTGSGGRECWN